MRENRTIIPFLFAVLLMLMIVVGSAWGQKEITKKTANDKGITILIIEGVIQPVETLKGIEPAMGIPSKQWIEVGKKIKIDENTLARNFNEFMGKMEAVFKEIPKTLGAYTVDEIELHLSINAEGGIEIIGKATIGMTTGIKVILKKRP